MIIIAIFSLIGFTVLVYALWADLALAIKYKHYCELIGLLLAIGLCVVFFAGIGFLFSLAMHYLFSATCGLWGCWVN